MRAKTGKTWRQWVRVLDDVDATKMPHRAIADWVYDSHDLSGWWAQMVTVGYERIRGLRDVGQRRGGSYEATKSKTVTVPLDRLYHAWSDKRSRERWLPVADLTVRKATANKSLRITWSDGTSVMCWFTAKGAGRPLGSPREGLDGVG